MARMTYIVPDDAEVYREGAIILCLERGDSIADIARSMSTTPQTIHNVLRRMGYSYSRTKGWRRA